MFDNDIFENLDTPIVPTEDTVELYPAGSTESTIIGLNQGRDSIDELIETAKFADGLNEDPYLNMVSVESLRRMISLSIKAPRRITPVINTGMEHAGSPRLQVVELGNTALKLADAINANISVSHEKFAVEGLFSKSRKVKANIQLLEETVSDLKKYSSIIDNKPVAITSPRIVAFMHKNDTPIKDLRSEVKSDLRIVERMLEYSHNCGESAIAATDKINGMSLKTDRDLEEAISAIRLYSPRAVVRDFDGTDLLGNKSIDADIKSEYPVIKFDNTPVKYRKQQSPEKSTFQTLKDAARITLSAILTSIGVRLAYIGVAVLFGSTAMVATPGGVILFNILGLWGFIGGGLMKAKDISKERIDEYKADAVAEVTSSSSVDELIGSINDVISMSRTLEKFLDESDDVYAKVKGTGKEKYGDIESGKFTPSVKREFHRLTYDIDALYWCQLHGVEKAVEHIEYLTDNLVDISNILIKAGKRASAE